MLQQRVMYPNALMDGLMCYIYCRSMPLDTVSSNILHNVSFISPSILFSAF